MAPWYCSNWAGTSWWGWGPPRSSAWLCPPRPCLQCPAPQSRASSTAGAGHVFSFSPDNDSAAGLERPRSLHCCPGHCLSQRRRQSWPQPGHVAAGAMRPSPGHWVPTGHGPPWPLCLCLRFTWHGHSWPRSSSWPGAGGSAAPVWFLGLSAGQFLPCCPFLSAGLSQVRTSSPRRK